MFSWTCRKRIPSVHDNYGFFLHLIITSESTNTSTYINCSHAADTSTIFTSYLPEEAFASGIQHDVSAHTRYHYPDIYTTFTAASSSVFSFRAEDTGFLDNFIFPASSVVPYFARLGSLTILHEFHDSAFKLTL